MPHVQVGKSDLQPNVPVAGKTIVLYGLQSDDLNYTALGTSVVWAPALLHLDMRKLSMQLYNKA